MVHVKNVDSTFDLFLIIVKLMYVNFSTANNLQRTCNKLQGHYSTCKLSIFTAGSTSQLSGVRLEQIPFIHHVLYRLFSKRSLNVCFNFKNQVKVHFYPTLPEFRKLIVFWIFPRLHPFVLLVIANGRCRLVWRIGGTRLTDDN